MNAPNSPLEMIPAMGFDFPKTLIKADAPLKKPSDAALLTLTVEAVAAEADVIATEPTENTEMAANAVAMIQVLILVFPVIVFVIVNASFIVNLFLICFVS